MSTKPRILAFAGSLRKDSYNKKLVAIAAQGARDAGADVTLIDLADYPLPLFDEDCEREQGMPENGAKLKQLFLEHDGLLISSPEYNSGFSAVLKNAIDWVSRSAPGEKPLSAYVGKTAALIAASPGGFGGLRGLVPLRMLLGNIQVLVIPDQIVIAQAHEAFALDGSLKDAGKQAGTMAIGRKLAETIAKLK
jgi:chromate reductase